MDRHVCGVQAVDTVMQEIDPKSIFRESDQILSKQPSSVAQISSPKELIASYLALFCALDDLLYQRGLSISSHNDSFELRKSSMPSDFPVEFDSENYYVIPLVGRTRRFVAHSASRRYGRLFPVHHAIFPTCLKKGNFAGLGINVVRAPRSNKYNIGSVGSERIHGVVFDGLAPTIRTEPKLDSAHGRFSVDDVTVTGSHRDYINQVADGVSRLEEASGLVFPELTISPDALGEIKSQLTSLSRLDIGMESTLDWVFAGTWHYRDAREPHHYVENRGEILNRFGTRLASASKTVAFESRKKIEGVVIGKEALNSSVVQSAIQILVTDRSIIAFLICKDFCDVRYSRLLLDLAVDIVVVAAMGDNNTMKAHGVVINQIRTERRTKSFVVQQDPFASQGCECGFVFPSRDQSEVDGVAEFSFPSEYLSRLGGHRDV